MSAGVTDRADGAGCGWSIPFLIKINEEPDVFALAELTPEQCAEQHTAYRASDKVKNTFQIGD